MIPTCGRQGIIGWGENNGLFQAHLNPILFSLLDHSETHPLPFCGPVPHVTHHQTPGKIGPCSEGLAWIVS